MKQNIRSIRSLGILLAWHAIAYAQQPFPGPATTPAPPGLSEMFWKVGLEPSPLDQDVVSVPLPGETMRLDRSFRTSPLAFERNDGQVDAEAEFLSRGPGYHLYLTATEAVMVLYEARRGDPFDFQQRPWWGEAPAEPGGKGWVSSAGVSPHRSEARANLAGMGGFPVSRVLRMRLVGANPSPSVRGEDELRGKVNYFLGKEPSLWRTNIATYARVRLDEVYPGVDLVYYGNQRELEYDLVVAPSADPDAIKLAFEGADKIEVDDAGELILHLNGRQVRWHRPRVYQELNGARHEIAAAYRLNRCVENPASGESSQVAFQIAAYDRTLPLVIDPVLVYSTYLGGSADDYAFGIAVDSKGSAYITGGTQSLNFPKKNALQAGLRGLEDAFVTKLNPTGDAIVYSTYLGGSDGDAGDAIAVDATGSAYVNGVTTSANFPTTNALQSTYGEGFGDAFVVKLSPDGAGLIFSTYLGGSRGDWGGGIVLDGAANVYVIGETTSADFPTVNPFQAQFNGGGDGFVAKIDATGTRLVYSTYLGGSSGDAGDASIAVDTTGHAYVAGVTYSTDFPTKNAIQPQFGGGSSDAFIAKLSQSGAELEYATYLGGAGDEGARGIAVDANGIAYVTGHTGSDNLPTTPQVLQPSFAGGFGDAFVAKLNPAGSAFDYVTYLGGSDLDSGGSIAVDTSGNASVIGQTRSLDFPTMEPIQAQFSGGDNYDAFVAKLDSAGSALHWSTYFGTGSENVGAIALDSTRAVYFAGRTGSSLFPVQGGVQSKLAGANDAFVVKIQDQPPRPLMHITRSGTTMSITWPVSATGFNLEVSDSLAPAPNWALSPDVPVIVGDQSVVTVQAGGSMKFFRLRKN